MLENLCYGMQWCAITGGIVGISIIIALIIQAIVYRTTKISIYKILMKSLLK